MLRSAYYYAPIVEFLRSDLNAIYGELGRYHGHSQELAEKMAWLEEIELLRQGLRSIPEGWLALEFSIPRMGKRADAIVLLDGIVFVIEFKVGAERFTSAAIEQVTDYALDLKNFHSASHDRIIVPVVVSTDAKPKPIQLPLWEDEVSPPILSVGDRLGELLSSVVRSHRKQSSLDPLAWMNSAYKPTPTIVEAAQALYKSHKVEEIITSTSGRKNLGVTTDRLNQIIEAAKSSGEKVICFITGVPGAGKTLAGLNLVTQRRQLPSGENAVFLSGNGPLVDVLREALAKDQSQRRDKNGARIKISDARRKVKSFIQNIHHFRDHYRQSPTPPHEMTVVFDEAQRAWDRDKISKFMRDRRGDKEFDVSEPEFLIGVMNRHPGWCAIVCLVGGGQEIYAGEAGLSEWFLALSQRYPKWKVFTSDQLLQPDYHWGKDLRGMISSLDHQVDSDLHLATAIRSFRAEKLSQFVNDLIAGDAGAASATYQSIRKTYPIVLTRDLESARMWLRAKARGSERYGLVASAGALRLKPEGLFVKAPFDAPIWFLNSRHDVRSSFYLEDAATEFAVQGLELDWIGVCWDADFSRQRGGWVYRAFKGTRWQNVKAGRDRRYLANAYRVLLTRARQGMVIYVPLGDPSDPTRSPEYYDAIARYLEECGVPMLEDTEQEVLRKVDLT
ncbi:MAG: DUF2075 domain-containing protein [Alphaproteobacteria bacterium]|nr:DUF2075 domain-containing protein [Alphaproteobacteria bacterium]